MVNCLLCVCVCVCVCGWVGGSNLAIGSNIYLSFIFDTSEFERKHGRIPENAIVFMYTGGEEVGLPVYHLRGIL